MSNLFVVSFNNESGAEDMLAAMVEWQRQNLIKIDDVAIAVRGGDNNIRIKYADQLVGKRAMGGGFWHSFIGLLSDDPVIGDDADSAVNTLIADHKSKKMAKRKGKKQTGVSLDPNFIREVSENLKIRTSAIFVYTQQGDKDKILPQLKKFKGRLIESSLTLEDAEVLKENLGVPEETKPRDPLDIIGNVK